MLRWLCSCLGRCQLGLQPGTALSQKLQIGIGSCSCSALVSQLRVGRRKLLAQNTASIRQGSKQVWAPQAYLRHGNLTNQCCKYLYTKSGIHVISCMCVFTLSFVTRNNSSTVPADTH